MHIEVNTQTYLIKYECMFTFWLRLIFYAYENKHACKFFICPIHAYLFPLAIITDFHAGYNMHACFIKH